MRARRMLLTAVILGLTLSTHTSAQMSPAAIVAANRSTETATRAIAAGTLSAARTDGRIGVLGSQVELATARLGAAIPVYFVRLDRLRDYQANSDPLQLLTEPSSVYYPVVSGSKAASLIEIGRTRADSPWKVITRGQTLLAARFAERAGTGDGGSGQQLCVWVAGLNQRFFGELQGSSLQLTPLEDSQLFDFRRGTTLPATTVFFRLRDAARQMGDGPGR